MACPDDGAADARDEVHPALPPHVAQQSCWDCGVACAEMALLARRLPVGRADLVKQLVTSSVWSIDLAYALTRCGVECVYYTTAIGVKSSHAMHGFYQDTFSDDEVRVNSLFARAASNGVRVHERAMSATELADLITAGALAIVLVNAPDLAVATPVAAGRLTSLLHSAAACVSRVIRTSDYFGAHCRGCQSTQADAQAHHVLCRSLYSCFRI